jgi:hypothetical protein
MRFRIGPTPRQIAKHQRAVARQREKLRAEEGNEEEYAPPSSPGYRVERSPEETAAILTKLEQARANLLAIKAGIAMVDWGCQRVGLVRPKEVDSFEWPPAPLTLGQPFQCSVVVTRGVALRLGGVYLGDGRIEVTLVDTGDKAVLRLDVEPTDYEGTDQRGTSAAAS